MTTLCEREGCDTPASVFRPTEAICKPHHIADKTSPHKTDKDMFLNTLGALLASTMRSEFDDDDCEATR